MNIVTLIIAVCSGISTACAVLLIGNYLDQVKPEKNRKIDKRLPLLFKVSMPLLPLMRPAVSGPLFASWRNMDESRLQMAGHDEILPAADFTALRLLFFVYAAAFALIGASSSQPAMSLFIAVMLALFPTLWLSAIIKKRHTSIMKALPNVLDLLTLSIEAGRDLLSSLRDILARRQMDPLGEELTRTLQEIQLGRQRTDALRSLARRVRQIDLTSTINAIIQAEEFGVSIGQLLRIQGDMQRNKRFAMAEKLANESSVKIIIPVVLCILPAVFIILMGPLITQALRVFD